MAVAVVQTKTVALGSLFAGDGITELTFDANTTVGNRVLVFVGTAQSSRDITSITDNGAGGVNTYSEISTLDVSTGEPTRSWAYLSSVIAAASSTVTVNLSSATGAESLMVLFEISGLHATTPVENVSILDNSGTPGTTHTLPNITHAATGNLDVVLQWMNGTGSYTIDADFTQVFNNARGVGGWDQVGSGTLNAVITSAGSEGGVSFLIGFQPAAAGGSTPERMLLLGVG